eukprot:gene27408-33776_t
MAVYYIIQKPSLAKYPPIAVTTWEYLIGGVVTTVWGLMHEHDRSKWILSGKTIWVLVYCVVFNSVAKYPISAYCNKRVN